MEFGINALIVFLILGLTYALTSEGLWGSALMFFNVLFGALIAFNFYEPLSAMLDGTGIGWGFSDTLCLMLLFSISVLLLRMTTETIAPAQVRFPMPVYHAGRLLFGLGGAAIRCKTLPASAIWRQPALAGGARYRPFPAEVSAVTPNAAPSICSQYLR